MLFLLMNNIVFDYKETETIDPESKIIFEDCEKSNFTIESKSIDKEESYNVNIKLNYDGIPPRSYETEEEKKIEYTRLKKYFSNMNEKKTKNIDFSKFDNVYISSYSPYISIDTSYDSISSDNYSNLTEIASHDEIETITINKSERNMPDLLTSQIELGAYSYIQNSTYTGEGVTVGILEVGIPNKSHSNLANTDITIRDVWNAIETKQEHTTIMASIIAGTNGFAPSAKLLCAQVFGDAQGEVEWMLDRGVNVINCSYGDTSPTGKYSNDSAYFDFIAYTYHTLFVCAAGNCTTSNRYICNPGLGYNVLTVGTSTLDPSDSNWMKTISSEYEVDGPRKPDILAPGYNITINPFGSHSGSSISTAITTGGIALILEKNSSFRVNPLLIIPLLTSSADNRATRSFGYGYDEESGAGVIYFGRALERSPLARQWTPEDYPIQTFTRLKEGYIYRICLFWVLTNTTGKTSGTISTAYKVTIYYYDDHNVTYTCLTTPSDNKRFMEFVIPLTGRYTIDVEKVSSSLPDSSLIMLAASNSQYD